MVRVVNPVAKWSFWSAISRRRHDRCSRSSDDAEDRELLVRSISRRVESDASSLGVHEAGLLAVTIEPVTVVRHRLRSVRRAV